jgi:hypothetical protein
MASVWDVEYNNNNEINHGQQFALPQQNQQNMQQLLTQPHAKYEAHSIQGRVSIFSVKNIYYNINVNI